MNQKLYCTVQTNTQLHDLRLSTRGRDVLWQAELIARLCRHHPRSFTFALFDRTQDTYCRVAIQAEISGSMNNNSERSAVEFQELREQTPRIPSHAQDVSMHLKCLQWACDHLFFHFPDFYASLFDMATKYSPAVLTLLTLDISALCEITLACIQRIVARSDLEYLCILCTTFDSILSHVIAHILQSVKWRKLKYLM